MGKLRHRVFGHLRKSAKLINGKARVMSPGSLVTESGFLPASGFHFGLSWIVLGGKRQLLELWAILAQHLTL